MFEFKLPDLGEGVHEGQIVSVLVKEGDRINEYQPMLEVETDKAAVEIPSPKTGMVSKLHVQPGQTVKVGQVLVVIDDGAATTATAPAAATATAPARPPSPPAPAPRPSGFTPAPPAPRPAAPAPAYATPQPAVAVTEPAVAHEGPIPAAPAVRKLARELGVDIARVTPSGPGGRVLREDVERHASGGAASTGARTRGVPVAGFELPAPETLPDFAQYGPVRRQPATQIRKTIARQMTRAWLSVPRVTHGDIADITELERNRKSLNAALKESQPKMTMTAIVLKAVAMALREYPMLNCSYDVANEEIVYKDYVHVGVAVDTPRGLVVPVVRDVDRKSLPQIAADLNTVADKARQAKFEVADLRGATFTVTNVGAIGGTFATPMVNFPEVGILGLGKAELRPVVRDGQIVARLMLPLALSFDHRVVDGADAARFTQDVVRSLENPLRLISLA